MLKDYSEYKSADEVILDAAARGWIHYTKEGKLNLPERPRKINQERVTVFMGKIVEAITESAFGKVKSSKLMKMLRQDNYPDEYKIAIRRLIEERKIREEKLVTGDIGRPSVYYYLFEF